MVSGHCMDTFRTGFRILGLSFLGYISIYMARQSANFSLCWGWFFLLSPDSTPTPLIPVHFQGEPIWNWAGDWGRVHLRVGWIDKDDTEIVPPIPRGWNPAIHITFNAKWYFTPRPSQGGRLLRNGLIRYFLVNFRDGLANNSSPQIS
jgi:hypothetical protein